MKPITNNWYDYLKELACVCKSKTNRLVLRRDEGTELFTIHCVACGRSSRPMRDHLGAITSWNHEYLEETNSTEYLLREAIKDLE